jgi:hypothetical protein
MNEQIVYILTNESMPGYTKIGITTDQPLETRVRQLDTTSVPLPFVIHYAAIVVDAKMVEGKLHDAFDEYRVRKNREFFYVDPERVVSALQIGELKNITPKNELTFENANDMPLPIVKKIAPKFQFEAYGIPVGSEIVYSRDDSIKAYVAEGNKVMYQGETLALSPLSKRLLGYNYLVRGPLYWKYNGELLSELKKRFENGDEL